MCPSLNARATKPSTDAHGVFRINGLHLDLYDAEASAAGHLPAEQRLPFSLCPGHGIVDVTIPLPPEATISGQVLNPEGAPVTSTTVEALTPTGQHRFAAVAQTKMNAQGAYTLNHLSSGTYLIAVAPRQSALYFLPGTIDAESAQSVPLSYGQEYRGAEIRLLPVTLHAISGKIERFDRLPPATKLRLLLYSRALQIEGARPRPA